MEKATVQSIDRALSIIEALAGEYKAIPLGAAIELPRGYEAIIAPRSSTFKQYFKHSTAPHLLSIFSPFADILHLFRRIGKYWT